MQIYSQALSSEYLSFHLAPIPTPIHSAPALSPSLPPHPNTRNTEPVSNRPGKNVCGGRGRGERGSLGPLKLGWRLGFFGWEGEEGSPCGLLYVEYVWIRVNELMDSWNTHTQNVQHIHASIHSCKKTKKQKSKHPFWLTVKLNKRDMTTYYTTLRSILLLLKMFYLSSLPIRLSKALDRCLSLLSPLDTDSKSWSNFLL